MSDAARPSDAVIIEVQKAEIERLNDNRIFLMAAQQELQAQTQEALMKMAEEISRLRALVPEDVEPSLEE